MSKFVNKPTEWAINYITSHLQDNVICIDEISVTSYSKVHRLQTLKKVYYLKQVPKKLYIEPTILNYLDTLNCHHIPKMIAYNNNEHCFLMASCGDITLRQLFQGKIDLTMIIHGMTNYTILQRNLENNVDELLRLSVPDWRLEKFPALYRKLIEHHTLLVEDGLLPIEIEQLNQLYPTCVKLCEQLIQYNIPETISHNDFHENNLLLDKSNNNINIIDWSEIVITHPFLSLNGLLWNLQYFYDENQVNTLHNELIRSCINAWTDRLDNKLLLEAMDIARVLNAIYAALAYEKMYDATKHQQQKVQDEHPGSIAGCLRSFMHMTNPDFHHL